ncbi:aromatic amino acid lyase, partial [Candidatus Beckwithbacteria bacterium]|nr:aromatic amino acid lyase [Candidatus Beckwithbacteria bacterium]
MPVNNFKYQSQKLLDCVHSFSHKDKKEEIFLDGENLSFKDMNHIFENETKVSLTQDQKILARIKHCYEHMIKQVENGVPVYGVNTGYGGQASLVVNEGTKEQRLAMAQKISDSIVHVDVSTGPVVPKAITRLAIAIRANMLMKGVSAVCPEDIYKFC